MSQPSLRPRDVASGALLLGGIYVLLFPHHALSVLRVTIVTLAAATGAYALLVTAPTAWWTSPFERKRRAAIANTGSEELDSIRSMFSGRRQAIEGGPTLPPQTMRLLTPLIEGALDRAGLDLDKEADRDRAKAAVSAPTWAILTEEPLMWPRWYQTKRPNEREVSRIVQGVLDDLDRLSDNPRRQIEQELNPK
ncbi:MAG: hypothetical protein ACR2QM_15515 [Longimicrobiales bacterium]